jgi:hypothetical protein
MIRIVLVSILFFTTYVFASDCPQHKDHQRDGVNERGDKAMGFSHEKTTHHFLLKENGGIIQVEVNNADDVESRSSIRSHLSHIAVMFSEGNFETPMFIHDREPAGVSVMKELKNSITYKYEESERGGKVIVSSNNSDAVKAIHDFLRFQIEDHKTGDPLSAN